MRAGELYRFSEPELTLAHARGQQLLERYNATKHDEERARRELLEELLAAVGERVVIQPPLHCDYGSGISIGDRTFVNYGAVMLDAAPIQIGGHCQIAPNVQLLTATHPIDPAPRRRGWEYALPIAIGENVWLGGGVIVCPGVSIGEHCVIGAGAVVTRDVEAGVVAVGNPARAVRRIGAGDRIEVPEG